MRLLRCQGRCYELSLKNFKYTNCIQMGSSMRDCSSLSIGGRRGEKWLQGAEPAAPRFLCWVLDAPQSSDTPHQDLCATQLHITDSEALGRDSHPEPGMLSPTEST